MKKILKAILPLTLYSFCKNVFNKTKTLKYKIGKRNHICPLCNKKFARFMPSGIETEVFKTLNIIGGGYRNNSICPYCYSTERLRLLSIYLSKYTDIFNEVSSKKPVVNSKKYKILHFAPEKMLEEIFINAGNIDYISCDIEKDRAMAVIDITDIPFDDNTFDYIICNHVLEHIPDESKAFSEIKRVIKEQTGIALLTVPICPDLSETLERKDTLTEADRLKYYGQVDHVRLYGLDFKQRLMNAGFDVKTFNSSEDCPELIDKYFLLPNETLFITMKKEV